MEGAKDGSLSMSDVSRRAELFEWMKFCKEKIDPIDKVWNRRLEDPPSDESEDEREHGVTHIARVSEVEQDQKHEDLVKGILGSVPARNRPQIKVGASEAAAIRKAIADAEDDEESKDSKDEDTWEEPLSPKMEN